MLLRDIWIDASAAPEKEGTMTTAIVANPYQQQHDQPGHPEHAARLQAIEVAIEHLGLDADLLQLDARQATEAQVRAVHDLHMIERLEHASIEEAWLNPDTYTTAGSWKAAFGAAGAAVQAVEQVVRGQVANAFALIRPPGHHATSSQAMGFCLFNNIAIAARYALDNLGIQRLAIVDYDVHHGNGTQDIFYRDERVLFCSTHAYGQMFYPGTGSLQEMGAGRGYGLTLNIPLPFHTGDQGFERVYEELVEPAVRAFTPQLVLVSAGYDSHWADPIGPLALSVAGYTRLTQRLVALAEELCGGQIVLVLEGGYNLQALAACVVATLRVLLGRDPGADPFGPAGGREADLSRLIERVRQTHPIFATR